MRLERGARGATDARERRGAAARALKGVAGVHEGLQLTRREAHNARYVTPSCFRAFVNEEYD